MRVEEGANKSVGAARVCVGNHDNPVSSHQQSLPH